MTQPKKHNDGKLLFAIAGGILVIAAGIAILASLGQSSEAERSAITATPAVRTAAVEPAVLPATSETKPIEETSSLADLVEETETTPEPFVVDPNADFVKQGVAAFEARRFDEAAAYFTAEAEARPDRPWTHYILALSLWKSGDADEAAAEMRRSLEIDSDQVKAFVNLARIENDRGEFDAALTASDEALALDGENAEAWFLRARSLYNGGDREAALAAIEQSVARDEENGYAHNLAGLIWIERGEGSFAVTAMEQAAERIPDVSFVQNNLGMALELDGRLDEAAVAYARSVELSPGHERAAMNLARLDGRIPDTEDDSTDTEPVVAVLTEPETTDPTVVAESVSDESEIPD